MDFLFNLWANSHLSNWSWMYFPNRLLFSLRTVFAFPNASRMGFESRILCSILFTLAISSFLCGKGENVIYLGISLCHGVTKRKIAARHRKMSPTWKKASYLEFVKSVMKCISFRVVHVCKIIKLVNNCIPIILNTSIPLPLLTFPAPLSPLTITDWFLVSISLLRSQYTFWPMANIWGGHSFNKIYDQISTSYNMP